MASHLSWDVGLGARMERHLCCDVGLGARMDNHLSWDAGLGARKGKSPKLVSMHVYCVGKTRSPLGICPFIQKRFLKKGPFGTRKMNSLARWDFGIFLNVAAFR